jgi:hypothetical protein
MPRSALVPTIRGAVKVGLVPLLRKDGFKKRGMTFYLITDESNRLVHLQLSQWNTSSLSRFTIELGLYFPAIDAMMNQTFTEAGGELWSPKIYNCQLRKRIGHLFPVPRDFWWEVMPTSNPDELAVELDAAWRQFAAPWLRNNADLQVAVTELENQSLYWPAAAGRLALGQRAEASRLAKEFVLSLTKEAPHRANAAIVEKYLKEIREWCMKHNLQL